MALKGKPVAIGNTATTIYTCPATKEAAVHGLLFGNNTASALAVDVIVYNQATGTDVTVVTDLAVPANGVATWSKPINLNAGDAVKAVSSAASGMVCLYSTYEDGATPVASGFTARGAWSSAASYVANDIVSVTGSGTYVAIQASTNEDPTTATAYWMFLEGISASALPAQSGNAGKYLATDGTTASWADLVIPAGSTTYSSQSTDITLVATDDLIHKITMSNLALSVTLPDATTLSETVVYYLINDGGELFSIKNDSGEVLSSVSSGSTAIIMLNDKTTSDGDWTVIIASNQGEFAVSAESILVANQPDGVVSTAKVTDTAFMVAWQDGSNMKMQVFETSSGSIVGGTIASFSIDITYNSGADTQNSEANGLVYLQDNSLAHWVFEHDNAADAGGYWYHRAISVSGTTITVGSKVTNAVRNYTSGWTGKAQRIDNNRYALFHSHYDGGWDSVVEIAQVSGTSVSVSSIYSGHVNNYPYSSGIIEGTSYVHILDGSGSVEPGYYARRYNLSGTTLSSGYNYYSNATYFGYSRTSSSPYAEMFNNNSKFAWIGYVEAQLKLAFVSFNASNETEGHYLQTVPNTSGTTDFDISYLSTSGTVHTFGLVTGIAAGLSGAGTSFRKVTWDESTNLVSYGSASFLLPSFGVTAARVSGDKSQESYLIPLDSATTMYVVVRDGNNNIKAIQIKYAA